MTPEERVNTVRAAADLLRQVQHGTDAPEQLQQVISQLATLEREVQDLQSDSEIMGQLQEFKRKVNRPRFWTAAFAECFAESLSAMDQAHRPLEVSTPEEVQAAFQGWHADMEAGLELFQKSGFDAEVAEGLRRDLICQWVYLRWLELTDDLGQP